MSIEFVRIVRSTLVLATALLAAWAIFQPLAAHAQACSGGRVAVEGGYCCWPGQAFDVDRNACAGPPACPAGMLASGAECVAAIDESLASGREMTSTEPRRVQDGGLIAGGIAMMSVGYLGAVVTSIIMGQQTSSHYFGADVQVVPNWWVGFFPVVHAAAAIGACTQCGSYDLPVIIAGVAGAALEIGGAVMLALGVIGHEDDAAIAIGPAQLRFGAASAEAGLTLDLAF